MSRCLFIGGCIEPNELFLLSEVLTRGMTFVDIGANEGLYSLFAARRVGPEGRVLAIEPSWREFARFQTNLRLNQLTNVISRRIALSSQSGQATLKVAGYEHEGQNTLGAFVHNDVTCSHSERVIIRPLDELVDEEGLRKVDIIKLDVEGAEFSVLDGARRILTTYRPLVLLEVLDPALRCQGSSAAEVLALLRSLGYEVFAFDKLSGRPVRVGQDSELTDNIVGAHPGRTWKGLNADQ